MSRLLLLFAILIVLFILLKNRKKQNRDTANDAAEDMVRCAHCGVHLPRSESIQAAGRFYCCREHFNASAK